MTRPIIIDDEADARETLQIALGHYCPSIEFTAICASPEEGILTIKDLCTEVVFPDIQMPHMSGFQLLEQLGEIDFEVVFTTAFDQYAIKPGLCIRA